MSHKPPHSSRELSNLPARRILLALFTDMKQALEKAIHCLESDCRRMISATKNGTESLNDLLGRLEEYQPHHSQEWLESSLCQVKESNALFGRATQQIQFYDILQQQLAHVGQTYQILGDEIAGLEPENQSQQATAYLYALPEIIQLHTSQLIQLHRQYTTEIEEWQTKLLLTVEKLTRLERIFPGEVNGGSTGVTFDANLLASLRDTIYSLMNEWQRFRQQGHSLITLSTILATVQTSLVQVAQESPPLDLPPDSAAKVSALQHLRASYTMQSERDMHDQVLGGLLAGETSATTPPQDHPVQSIELF
jgi:hypothetical protein